MVQQKCAQRLVVCDGRSLQKLPKLMDLDALVHVKKPLPGLFHGFRGGSIDTGLEIGARRQFNHTLAGQCGIEGIKQASPTPVLAKFVQVRCRTHIFTIQFVTACVKRAATALRSPLYCTATTQASVSSVPSEFCSRNISTNSRGRLEANKTSRAVPYSITVLSEYVFPSFAIRVNRTGMRTCVASGKNFASLLVELSLDERARAVAALGTELLDSQGSTREG